MINEHYLSGVKKTFHSYKSLGEKAIEQLDAEKLFFSHNEETNSIAIIIQHMSGNMLSRWTDFLTTDGEKQWRNRDSEFETITNNKKQLMEVWEKGWKCLFNALDELKAEQLLDKVFIRNEAHTVMEAINRQLAHYSYHIGQIVFYSKLLKQHNWQSLSIPKKRQ